MENLLIGLGFEDVADKYPIRLCDQFIGFDTIYPLNKKYMRRQNDITSIVMFGEQYSVTYIRAASYYKGRLSKFDIHFCTKYIAQIFMKYLLANEEKVKEL